MNPGPGLVTVALNPALDVRTALMASGVIIAHIRRILIFFFFVVLQSCVSSYLGTHERL